MTDWALDANFGANSNLFVDLTYNSIAHCHFQNPYNTQRMKESTDSEIQRGLG